MEIVCTVGPSSFDLVTMRTLGFAGATVFRLNLSYTPDVFKIDEFVLMVIEETDGKSCLDTHGMKYRPKFTPGLTSFDEQALRYCSLTEKGAGKNLNYVAISFAQNAHSLEIARKISPPDASIIAKIEDRLGVENSSEIIEEADIILIDRGDLSKSVPIEDVPSICINLIHTCKELKTPVWVATNLLESMVTQPQPTLAEVNDIASLILQGVDGLVLAAETAIGKYPVQCVEFVRKMSERYKV